MRKAFYLAAGLLVFHASKGQSSYREAHFTDSNRLEKIRATQPLVDRLYRDQAEKNHFPGLVYAVIADGQLAYSGSMGYTETEARTPTDTSSCFRIASMSKSFTALAILQLRDRGKLRLDDPARLYLPELKKLPYLTSDAPVITIRHLLTHDAGFPEDNPWGDRQLADTDSTLMALAAKASFSQSPGVGYEYSNLGFALLGRIISRVSGIPYQQYIRRNILEPLGMTHTYYEYTRVPPGLLAHGYQWKEGKWQEEGLLHDGAFGAMGGMISSIADFSKYMALHLSAWPPRDGAEGPVLKRSSLREMQSPHQFSGLQTGFRYASGRPCPSSAAYGFGLRWSIDCANKVFVGHSGGLPGFGSNWTILPEYGIGVVCFANLTYAPTAQLNLSILDTLVRIAGLQKRLLPPSPWLEQRKKALLALLPEWKDAKNSGIFAENFFPDHPLADLRAEARRLFARAGTIRQVSALVAENNLRGSFVLEGEKASLLVSFTLSPQNPPLIQEYHLSLVPEN